MGVSLVRTTLVMWVCETGSVDQPGLNTLPDDLRRRINDCGFFPQLVGESTALALGDEAVVAHLVHHEATFVGEEVHRHLNLMVATPTRLIVGHTDESTDNPDQRLTAITSTESVPLGNITSVSLTRVVAQPDRAEGDLVETWLSIGWGTMRRIEVEPAHCGDPSCDADHGMTGSLLGEDISVRMSAAADGAPSVTGMVTFASALQRLVGEPRR